jgi:flagellar capping protein FliD
LNFSDYNLIRSGSYYKLLKSYYSSDSSSTTSTDKTTSTTSTSTSKETSKTLANIESATDNLNESAEALYKTNSSVFKKVSSQTNGKSDYDTDAIYNAVSSFVDDYNSVIKAAGKSSASGITNAAESLTAATNQNADALKELGITIDSEKSTLSVDKETFLSADMDKAKKLFNGTGSYAYNVATKSSLLNYQAEREASKSNTYSSTGSYNYNYSSGSILNSYF